MSEAEISELIQRLVKVSKNHLAIKADKAGKYRLEPTGHDPIPYSDAYVQSVKELRKITVHAKVDTYPHELFKHRAPNQNEAEAKWIEANYRATTHPTWISYVSTTSRGLNDGNWSIVYRDGSEDTLRAYVETGLPVIGSLESWVKETLPSIKAMDANGIIAVRPYRVPTVQAEDGTFRVDPAAEIEPVPVYYSSEQLIHFDEGHVAVVELRERSRVQYGQGTFELGRIFEVYTRDAIWRVVQVGKQVDHTFEVFVWYPHDSGQLHVHKLKGLPIPIGDGNYTYQSPFYHAVPLLDSALLQENYLYCWTANNLFPIRYELGNECDFVDKEGRRCFTGKFEDGTTCPSCKGTGEKSRLGTMGVLLIRPKSATGEGDTGISSPVGFVSPDVAPASKAQELIRNATARAESILHIATRNADQQGAGDGTATRENRDEKAMYAFIQPISDQTFDLYHFILRSIAVLRYGDAELTPSLVYPKTFDFKTEADYLSEIKDARDAGSPEVVVHQLILRYLRNVFYTDVKVDAVFRLIGAADRLLTLSGSEAATRVSQGMAEPWEIVLHDSGVTLVQGLLLADPLFLDKDLSDQVDALREAAKSATPAQNTTDPITRILNATA